MQLRHIRIIDVRGGRRINAQRGRSHTACGADPTAYDIEWSDAKKMSTREKAEWITCAECLRPLVGE